LRQNLDIAAKAVSSTLVLRQDGDVAVKEEPPKKSGGSIHPKYSKGVFQQRTGTFSPRPGGSKSLLDLQIVICKYIIECPN
jgi:hypothetical protein